MRPRFITSFQSTTSPVEVAHSELTDCWTFNDTVEPPQPYVLLFSLVEKALTWVKEDSFLDEGDFWWVMFFVVPEFQKVFFIQEPSLQWRPALPCSVFYSPYCAFLWFLLFPPYRCFFLFKAAKQNSMGPHKLLFAPPGACVALPTPPLKPEFLLNLRSF